VILDNGNVLIGVNAYNNKQIITEDIRDNNHLEIIAQHEHEVLSLLVDEARETLWAGDRKLIVQYLRGPAKAWKIQAKYSDLGIATVCCFSRFGNLLFAGGNGYTLCVINTADKKVLPEGIETAIFEIRSLQICEVSPSETYLSISGSKPCYSDNKTDLFDISKCRQLSFAQKIFSKPEFHLSSICHQMSHFTIDKPSNNNGISKLNDLSYKKS
jgi:hypothetical protein